MAVQNDNGFTTFVAGATIAAFVRVKLDGSTPNQVVVAGAGESHIGITQAGAASGEDIPVKLCNAPGTFKCTTSGAVTANAGIYGTASGKIDDAGTGNIIGQAREAATASGDIIEFIHWFAQGNTTAV